MGLGPWLKAAAAGVAIGIALAGGLALFVTTWELVENPGGIFRTEQGWRWDFVGETAASWFLPTLLPAIVLGLLLALAFTWLRQRGA